jgi:hypothetical protein
MRTSGTGQAGVTEARPGRQPGPPGRAARACRSGRSAAVAGRAESLCAGSAARRSGPPARPPPPARVARAIGLPPPRGRARLRAALCPGRRAQLGMSGMGGVRRGPPGGSAGSQDGRPACCLRAGHHASSPRWLGRKGACDARTRRPANEEEPAHTCRGAALPRLARRHSLPFVPKLPASGDAGSPRLGVAAALQCAREAAHAHVLALAQRSRLQRVALAVRLPARLRARSPLAAGA